MKLPYKIYNTITYWKLRNIIHKLQFFFRRKFYHSRYLIEEEKLKTHSAILFIKLSIWSILKAVIFVVVLFGIESLVIYLFRENQALIPDWLSQLKSIIPKPKYPYDKDAIIELVSVIASVSGVILALFYPVLATIASTAYAKVHASIRNLLLSEEETQNYLKRLTFLTACSITVLLLISFHYYPKTLVLSFLAFYSFTILFGILKIGLGVYKFFEPSTLSSIVFKNITEIIKNATTNGLYANDSNFQNHYYKSAYLQIENLSLITSLCLKDNELKESSFKESIKFSFYTLQHYLSKKPKIPVESLWFPRTYRHISFFESDMTTRGLSKDTNTFIQPKVKQNHFWLEERIINNVSYGLESLVKTGNINVLGDILYMTYPVFDLLSSLIDMESAETLFNSLLSNLKSITSENNKKIENYEDWKHELSCVQNYCYAILRFQIGVFERTTQFNSSKITSEYDKIDWNCTDTIYKTDFITDIYETLVEFAQNIKNEKLVEKKQITPDWYFRQKLVSEYLIKITNYINSTIKLFESHLITLMKHFDSTKNSLLSSVTAQFGLEIINKLFFRVGHLEPALNDIDKLEICKGEYKWIKPNFEEIRKLLNGYKVECLSIIADNAVELSLIKWNNQFPDIFAHSYSILSSNINQAFKDNDLIQFKKYFPSFLKSSLQAFENLNKIFKHYDSPMRITYQTLLDLMEISGYGYIYSIIYKKPEYWLSIKETWDENFHPSKENIKLFVAYYSYYKSNLFGVGINFNEKDERERTLYKVIQNLKIELGENDWIIEDFINDVDHMNYYDVEELFIEIYLFTFLESKDATSLIKRELFKHWLWEIEKRKRKE